MKKILAAAVAMSCLGIAHAKNDSTEINPLAKLIGVWEGDKGIDVAPAQRRLACRLDQRHPAPILKRS